MEVILTPLLRDGVLRPADPPCRPVQGNLSLVEESNVWLRRTGRVASLHGPAESSERVRKLYDAAVVRLERGQMLVSGLELDNATGQTFAQSWDVTMPAAPGSAMLLYDDEGRRLQRFRLCMIDKRFVGRLTIHEIYDRDLRRTLRIARLRDSADGADLLDPLRDAVVLWIGGDYLTVTGFTLAAYSHKSAGQSWYVEYLR